MRLVSGLLEAVVADALVRPHHVLAHAVGANPAAPRALVDVLTGALVRGQLVTRGTIAPVRPFGVDAVPSLAKPGNFLALVDVHADLHRRFRAKSLLAIADEVAGDVAAGPLTANVVGCDRALVDVCKKRSSRDLPDFELREFVASLPTH